MQPPQNKLHCCLLTTVTADTPSIFLHCVFPFPAFAMAELFIIWVYFSYILLYSFTMAALFITKWTTWLSGLLPIWAQWGVDIIEHSAGPAASALGRKRKSKLRNIFQQRIFSFYLTTNSLFQLK